jgi:DNA-binding CsgD family transcriptional regulator
MATREEDEAEILDLIHRNRVAVWMRDFEAWADCMVPEARFSRLGWTSLGGAFNWRGWEEISARYRTHVGLRPEPNPHYAYDTRVENLSVTIHGDMAWAIFDQVYPGGAGHVDYGLSHELRVLERYGGRWKIVVIAFIDGRTGEARKQRIRIDRDARVLWMSPAAEAALAEDDDLVVRAGRLRVRDARTNQKLQAAIRWAALDNDYDSKRGAVPIVVEAGEGLPTKIWWVEADAGLIHFSFGGTGLTEQRLELAALIYELSPAQRQLAGLVAEGLTLNEIAERMGITRNTARTHLNRVFDKTGVRTQPALVRVLLSVAAPL